MDAFAPSAAPDPVPTPEPTAEPSAAFSPTPDPGADPSPRVIASEGRPQRPSSARNALSALRLFALLLALTLLSKFFVVVPAGERGVLLRFGAVQPVVLSEGLHPLLPLRDAVKPMSVRVQSRTLRSEAASRDLQDVDFDLAVSWHLIPDQAPHAYQRLGDGRAIEATVIEPAVEDTLKAVVAAFTAEQLITERGAVKQALTDRMGERLAANDLVLDDIDLLQVQFSEPFRLAVEAKQVAEQDARRAEYEAVKAQRLAAARVFQAEGESRAQQLLRVGLTPEVLQHQAIEKWNGHLPLVVGREGLQGLNITSLMKADRKRG